MTSCLGENIPDFITKILHHLELYGTMKEGIYRVPGAKLEVDRLKSKLDTDPHCINIDFDGFNVNAVAAAFKDFLRKLPVPLLPYDVSKLHYFDAKVISVDSCNSFSSIPIFYAS